MSYFDDIHFINGQVIQDCHSVIDSAFPDTFNLQLILSGEIYYGVNHGEQVMLSKPALFWHVPENNYQYGPASKGKGWYHHWITFCGTRAEALQRNGFCQLSAAGYVYVKQPAVLADCFTRIIKIIHDEPHYHSQAVILLEQILSIAMMEQQYTVNTSEQTDLWHRIVNKIRQKPFEQYDFSKIAMQNSYSYSRFRQLFRSYSGKSPHDFVLYCRMKYCADELLRTNKSVKEIACNAGYIDMAQFSKTFKKQIGLSPAQYRNALPV